MSKRHRTFRPDSKAIVLKELRFMRHVSCFISEDFPYTDHASLCLPGFRHSFQLTNSHRRGVRAQNTARRFVRPECVLHISSWMVRRHIKRCKIVILILELRTIGDAEAHTAEYLRDVTCGDSNWVQLTFSIHTENIPDYGRVTPYEPRNAYVSVSLPRDILRVVRAGHT